MFTFYIEQLVVYEISQIYFDTCYPIRWPVISLKILKKRKNCKCLCSNGITQNLVFSYFHVLLTISWNYFVSCFMFALHFLLIFLLCVPLFAKDFDFLHLYVVSSKKNTDSLIMNTWRRCRFKTNVNHKECTYSLYLIFPNYIYTV